MSILRITSTTIEAAATAEMLLERALGQRGKMLGLSKNDLK